MTNEANRKTYTCACVCVCGPTHTKLPLLLFLKGQIVSGKNVTYDSARAMLML